MGPEQINLESLSQRKERSAPLLSPNPYDRHPSSVYALLFWVGRQEIGAAGRAERRYLDTVGAQTSVEELEAIGFGQVEEEQDRQFAMPRCPGCEEEHGILFAHRVQYLDLAKQLPGISELRFEPHPHFGADLETALANAGADGRLKILRLAAKIAPHFPHALLHNAPQRAAPSRMEHAHSFALGVDQNHGQAIGGLHAKD